MASDEFFTRDEVLGGLPAKRAAALLFLIESRTSNLLDESRRATEFFLSEDVSKERDLAFLEAFSLGREPPLRITIQDIERFASKWAALVPDNPTIRAAIALFLGQKYKFTNQAAPGIRAALALDSIAVRQAFRRLYRADLETIFARQVSWLDRLSWLWASLSRFVDTLSPFSLTFALTVAFSLSQAFLALPTGVAHIGPMAGIIIVVAVGLINVFTMACMAEACSRSGDFRYGKAFIGRLVIDYLGKEASAVFSMITTIRTFLVLLAGFLGIGLTLATFTPVAADVWIALLLVIELYYLSRESLNVTATTMVLLIGINIIVLLPVAILALSRADRANLFQVSLPFLRGEPFDPAILQLVFGVTIMLYIGHVYVIQCAKIVLPRDPSARSLIQGSVAGTAFLTLLFVIWVLAINGALAPQALAGQAGTALTPLAEKLGPSIHVLGPLLVVLLLGMSCLRTSTVLFNIARERVPTKLQTVVTMPRRRGGVVLYKRPISHSSGRVAFTYLGLNGKQPEFRLVVQREATVQRLEMTVFNNWNAETLLERFPELLPYGINAELEILQADRERARVRITSTMGLTYEGDWDTSGLQIADVLTLSDPARRLVSWITRRGEVDFAEVVAQTGQDEDEVRIRLDELVQQGFILPVGQASRSRYRIHLAVRRGSQAPNEIWRALSANFEPRKDSVPVARWRSELSSAAFWVRGLMLSRNVRFLLCASPVILVFLLAEGLLLTGTASFAAVLGFGGVIANSLTAGIFPVLLLVSSRKKGDFIPGVVYRFLDHPLFVTTVYLVFLANLFLHGLFIWRNPWARGTAVIFGLLVIGITIVMLCRGAFSRRTVLELRGNSRAGVDAVFTVISGGKPLTAEVQLGYDDGAEIRHAVSGKIPMLSLLRHATFRLPATSARELKVWAHKITPDGNSEGLAALLEIKHGETTKQFDLQLCSGQIILPCTGEECRLQLTFPDNEDSAQL
jgi:hypothetical protein